MNTNHPTARVVSLTDPWQPIHDDGFTVLLRDLHTMISRESAPKEKMLWMVETMQRLNGDVDAIRR